MTLPESAINELLTTIANGGGQDFARSIVEWGMQQLIEAEATEHVGADRFERSPDRIVQRNGHVSSPPKPVTSNFASRK